MTRLVRIALGFSLLSCATATLPPSTADRDRIERQEVRRVLESALASCPGANAVPVVQREQVYVEAVVLETPGELAAAVDRESVVRLAEEPGVRLLGTPHVIADVNERATTTVVERSGAVPQSGLYRMLLTPRSAEPDGLALELEFTLQEPRDYADRAAPRISRATMTLAPPHEGHAVVHTAALDGDPRRSLVVVVTHWRVRHDSDLRAIFECKMARQRRFGA